MLKIMKASAGSGKTYSLARTYISLLLRNEDRYAYRHILAVTFTNKATEEMKSRILKELHILATEPNCSDYIRDFVPAIFPDTDRLQDKAQAVLHDILHDYSAFAISTIDRFFQQALKAFSREIGQFASYQEELDRNSLIAESVDRILDSLTEESGSLLTWLTDNVLEQIEQGGRYSMDANLLDMALRLQSSQRQEAMSAAGVDDEKMCAKENLMKIRKACRDMITSFRAEVKSRARRALSVLEEAGVDPAESNRGFLKALYVYDELNENEAFDAPKDTFFQKASDHESWFAKSKAGRYLPLVYPFLESPLNDFCSLWEREYSLYNTACILDKQIYGLGVAGELRRTFKELMKEKNVLCIDDSNTILRDIIDGSDAPFIYEKLGVRFDHFLLDEFQDTSSVQWTNFSPLLHNSDSQGGENLIVGDVKQSIYRWRGSDWNLLNDTVPTEFREHEETVLDTNYRSLKNIVEFNNGFFEMASSVLDRMSGISEDGPLSKIYADVHQKVARDTASGAGSVTLTYCSKENELMQVLSAIEDVRASGASLADVAVLVRSNAIGEAVATFLIDNGITVITDDSLKVKSSITVRRLVSLMSYMDNPDNTISGYLADSLDMSLPDSSSGLVDMAEALIRGLKESDSLWNGEVRHIQSFMDCVQEYVASHGNSLRGFLKHWEDQDPSICSPSSGDSVRVMTVHKSKGLDFPYVIIPFAESITLYKPGRYWCSPDLSDTSLEGVADGVYDVMLSGHSESTLFADHYVKERFLQQVDNINTIYVAMTRASLGMHVIAERPSAKVLEAIEGGDVCQCRNFSQILYAYALTSDMENSSDGDMTGFRLGEIVDFNAFRRERRSDVMPFEIEHGDGYPSIPLNPDKGEQDADVRERGGLKFSADALDFFSEDGQAGIAASNRILGVVLHDILAHVIQPEDLEPALSDAVHSGEITSRESEQIRDLLSLRIKEGAGYGWFPEDRNCVMNEVSLIDTDGQVYRPDRVVKNGDSIVVVDYKFGEHYRKYEHQVRRYADIWRRMGYDDITAYLWYVHTGEIVKVS